MSRSNGLNGSNGHSDAACVFCAGTRQIHDWGAGPRPCPRCCKEEIAEAKEKRRLEKWFQPNWVEAVQTHSRATELARLVMIVLALKADRWGRVAMGRGELARRCHCRANTIKDILAKLRAMREIKRIREGTGRKSSIYRIKLPALMESRRRKHAPDVPGFRNPRGAVG